MNELIQQQSKSLNDIKRERDRNATNSQAKANKIDATQSELSIKTKLIADLTWELNEIRTKLIHAQQQLDTVCAERMTMEKQLLQITDDRNEVRDKLRVGVAILSIQINLTK